MSYLSGRTSPRVLQVSPLMAPHVGGLETHVQAIASRLPDYGIETSVLTVDPTGTLPVNEHIDGVTVERVRAWPANRDLRFAPGLYSRIAGGRWDLVHVQCFHSLVAPVAMATAATLKIPYVLTFHGGGHSSAMRRAIRRPQVRAMRPLLARARALVTIADFEAAHYNHILRLPSERFKLIPNGSDLPDPSPGYAPGPGTLIVSCGRLEQYKGHHLAIQALPYVLQSVPDARLWIAGRGPFEGALRKLARRLGVAERVEIGAAADRQSMADRLSHASLAVLLSTFETQPVAALEALALGVPIVVADNSGLAELGRKGLAEVVALADDASAHAAVMVGQIRNPMSVSHATLCSWDDCTEQLACLYRDVVAS